MEAFTPEGTKRTHLLHSSGNVMHLYTLESCDHLNTSITWWSTYLKSVWIKFLQILIELLLFEMTTPRATRSTSAGLLTFICLHSCAGVVAVRQSSVFLPHLACHPLTTLIVPSPSPLHASCHLLISALAVDFRQRNVCVPCVTYQLIGDIKSYRSYGHIYKIATTHISIVDVFDALWYIALFTSWFDSLCLSCCAPGNYLKTSSIDFWLYVLMMGLVTETIHSYA